MRWESDDQEHDEKEPTGEIGGAIEPTDFGSIHEKPTNGGRLRKIECRLEVKTCLEKRDLR